jgi:vacuole morphology and inheritance protein 14
MLLPQSSAFAALKNRLNSVSAIGYLHIAPRAPPPTPTAAFDRPNRLKVQEKSSIPWSELLEKFKGVQEKAKRASRPYSQAEESSSMSQSMTESSKEKALPEVPQPATRPLSAASGVVSRTAPPLHKPKSSLGNFSRLTERVSNRKNKK